MARSGYIYFVRKNNTPEILAAFTVKYEAYDWVVWSGWSFDEVALSRMKDGRTERKFSKEQIRMEWEPSLVKYREDKYNRVKTQTPKSSADGPERRQRARVTEAAPEVARARRDGD